MTQSTHRARSTSWQNRDEAAFEGSQVWAHLAALLPVTDLSLIESRESVVEPSSFFDQMARTLFHSKRGHILLTGLRGVGKTTAMHQFATLIQQNCYPFLTGSRIILIDVSNVGPEDSRGCLETIFTAVRELIEGDGHVLLCLDGLANLLKRGQGGTNKPLLRSLLSKNRIKVIGTMSHSEYSELIGNDAHMLEVFSRLEIVEPSGSELDLIMSEAGKRLADEFGLSIPRQIIERLVPLTSTFLLSESQPAKSIDVLRQICEEIDYDRTQSQGMQGEVTLDDLVKVIARRTGIPPETVNGQGKECDFERTLSDVVVGQEGAVREVATELRLISAGLAEPNKPASVLMFAGMTGVGKTELAKRVAELYSSSHRLQVYTMGNFTEPHSVSGIIGVPPGYVGHEEGGRLINELRADPYSVFLLDEAEKCHPNVWKPFLNLFDEGWIVDQRGVKAYADRAIFILTTNAGDRNIAQLSRSGKSTEEITQSVQQALARVRQERSSQPVFPPQFLSRMKRIIVFNPLEEAAMIGIAKTAVKRLASRWQKARNKKLVVDSELIQQIGQCAYSKNELSNGQEGGRIIQKLLSEVVEDEVYRKSLENRDDYERCLEIHVRGTGEPPEEKLRAEVRFSFSSGNHHESDSSQLG